MGRRAATAGPTRLLSKPFGVREGEESRARPSGSRSAAGGGGGGRHRRRRSRSAGVVGRDALSSPALAQLLRRRRRECVAARCRSPRSRAATGVTRALVLSSPSSFVLELAAVHLAATFRHGDSQLPCGTVRPPTSAANFSVYTRSDIRKRPFGAPSSFRNHVGLA